MGGLDRCNAPKYRVDFWASFLRLLDTYGRNEQIRRNGFWSRGKSWSEIFAVGFLTYRNFWWYIWTELWDGNAE